MIYNKVVPFLDMLTDLINNDKIDELKEILISSVSSLKEDTIREDILNCAACNLCTKSPHIPFEGNKNAEIMFIGEVPSEYDFQTFRPFSGPSGTIFQNMIRVAKDQLSDKFNMKNIWITNVNKCRPVDDKGNIVKPNASQIASCRLHLEREIELIKPKIIICLGSGACEVLIHPKFKLEEEHGKLFGDNIKILGTYSPEYVSYLGENTQEATNIKMKMWEDLKAAAEYLNSED